MLLVSNLDRWRAASEAAAAECSISHLGSVLIWQAQELRVLSACVPSCISVDQVSDENNLRYQTPRVLYATYDPYT